MSKLPIAKTENILTQEVKNEILIYNLETNQAFCLNQTSALVWQFCYGKNSIPDISDLMSKELKMLISEDFVWLAVSELQKSKLIENQDEFAGFFANLNRREIIKRVGLTSMIALPIISTVIAPTAANAASGGLACISGGVTGPPPNPPNVFAVVFPEIGIPQRTCVDCLAALNGQCCFPPAQNTTCSNLGINGYSCSGLCL